MCISNQQQHKTQFLTHKHAQDTSLYFSLIVLQYKTIYPECLGSKGFFLEFEQAEKKNNTKQRSITDISFFCFQKRRYRKLLHINYMTSFEEDTDVY